MPRSLVYVGFTLAVITGVAVADPRSADWRTSHIVAAAVAGTVVGVAEGAALLFVRDRQRGVTLRRA